MFDEEKKRELEKIFRNKKILPRDQFIINSFNNQAINQFFDRLEIQLSKYTDDIEKKYKINTQKFSLQKITKLEKRDVPKSVSYLCEYLRLSISNKSFDVEKEIHSLTKEEMIFCESIVNCINAGFIDELDFSEVPFIILLNSLKVMLKHLPETLFTEVISKKLLCIKTESYELEKLIRDVLDRVPLDNYNSIKCISKFVRQLFEISPKRTIKSLSGFFVSCFISTSINNEILRASSLLKFMFENANEFFRQSSDSSCSEKDSSACESSEEKKSFSINLKNLKNFHLSQFKDSFNLPNSDL